MDVRLADNFGKRPTVLLFFPLAFTGVCTTEMCDVTSGLSEYAELGADVLAVSVDSSHAQEAWAKAHGIRVTLLSDLNKEVTREYDVVLRHATSGWETSARAAFVISRDGVIVYSEQTPTPRDLPNFEAIRAAVTE